jgi:hypothetical protein
MSRLVKQCPQCGDERTLTLEGLAQELRGLGMLKRTDDWNETWGLALAAAARERLLCNQCGAGGVVVSPAPDDEWDLLARPCAACGSPIPGERVALYPDTTLCARCQESVEAGRTPDGHDDFCPHCGERMTVRMKRGSGIARYEQICPACRR